MLQELSYRKSEESSGHFQKSSHSGWSYREILQLSLPDGNFEAQLFNVSLCF